MNLDFLQKKTVQSLTEAKFKQTFTESTSKVQASFHKKEKCSKRFPPDERSELDLPIFHIAGTLYYILLKKNYDNVDQNIKSYHLISVVSGDGLKTFQEQNSIQLPATFIDPKSTDSIMCMRRRQKNLIIIKSLFGQKITYSFHIATKKSTNRQRRKYSEPCTDTTPGEISLELNESVEEIISISFQEVKENNLTLSNSSIMSKLADFFCNLR